MRVSASRAACLALLAFSPHRWSFDIAGERAAAPARAQTVPKSLEEGGSDAAQRYKKNNWTVGVAGGQLSGTYMTFANELAEVLDDGDNLRVIPIVTYGAASNMDDLLYLRQVDVAVTQADVFEYFRTQRKIPNLDYRVNYIVRLPVSEVHLLARHGYQDHRGPARQEGQLRAGRKRIEPDRDHRLPAPRRAGRASSGR